MLSKVDTHKWIKSLKLPWRIELQVLEFLRQARTPEDFEGKIRNLARRLNDSFRKWSEDYRSNWHSIHCECDECIALDGGG